MTDLVIMSISICNNFIKMIEFNWDKKGIPRFIFNWEYIALKIEC